MTCLVALDANVFLIIVHLGPDKGQARKEDPDVLELKGSIPQSRAQYEAHENDHCDAIKPLLDKMSQSMIQQTRQNAKDDNKTQNHLILK